MSTSNAKCQNMRAETQESDEEKMSFSSNRGADGEAPAMNSKKSSLCALFAHQTHFGANRGTILLFFFLAFAPARSTTVVSYLKNRNEKNVGHKCCHKIILLVLRSQGFNKAGV